jgi:hypothetical protein
MYCAIDEIAEDYKALLGLSNPCEVPEDSL